MKKGDIWISAVLYLALGVIILTIVLATSLPVINKLKDKNTIVQTKNLLSDIDQNIRAVYTEGAGSQRPITLSINQGEFKIDSTGEKIIWFIDDSRYSETQPGASLQEGNLMINTEKSQVEGRYIITLTLDYSSLLDLESELQQISGEQSFLIRNTGNSDNPDYLSQPRSLIEVIPL